MRMRYINKAASQIAYKMADKSEEDSSDSSSSDSDKTFDSDASDNALRSVLPIENQENGDASEAIERFLEQVAADNTTNKDESTRIKDKDREVKRASRMIIPPECKCHLNNGKPCHTRFSVAELMDTRMHYMTISKKELDIAVLAKLECGIHLSRMTTRKKRKPTERKKHRTDFYHRGYRICNLMFVYLHGFSYKKLKALIIQYKTNGVKTRIHKNFKSKSAKQERKKPKKKKLQPKPKEPKEKLPREKKSRKIKNVAELKTERDRNPQTLPCSSQLSPIPPVLHPLPPQHHYHQTSSFPISSQNDHPHAPAFSIASKHRPPHPFISTTGYGSTSLFTHHHSLAGQHHHPVVPTHSSPAVDFSSQRSMNNPPLDFSSQRNNILPMFQSANGTYSVLRGVDF